jgi:uncharacterized RDD family membrane protein YckC
VSRESTADVPHLAPLWKRLGGFLIDMAVSLGPVGLAGVGVLLESRAEPGSGTTGLPLAAYSAAVAWFAGAVAWYGVAARRSQSPGKQVVGTRVVRGDGRPAGAGVTLARQVVVRDLLGYAASMATGGLYMVVAAGLCLAGQGRQCLWDRMLGTFVVDARDTTGRRTSPR